MTGQTPPPKVSEPVPGQGGMPLEVEVPLRRVQVQVSPAADGFHAQFRTCDPFMATQVRETPCAFEVHVTPNVVCQVALKGPSTAAVWQGPVKSDLAVVFLMVQAGCSSASFGEEDSGHLLRADATGSGDPGHVREDA